MSAPMALADFIPVAMFLVSSVILQRCFYNKMSKGAFALLSAGGIMIFTGGFFKAAWKLLYCLNICDFERLAMSLMPMQSTGFFLIAAAMLAMLFFRQGKGTVYSAAAAPAVFSGTLIFIAMMCFGIGVLCAALSYFAIKLKRKLLVAVFAMTFIAMLAMGYLSSKDFAEPAMNWLAEGVNTAGQGLLLFGCHSLKKAGLADYKLTKD